MCELFTETGLTEISDLRVDVNDFLEKAGSAQKFISAPALFDHFCSQARSAGARIRELSRYAEAYETTKSLGRLVLEQNISSLEARESQIRSNAALLNLLSNINFAQICSTHTGAITTSNWRDEECIDLVVGILAKSKRLASISLKEFASYFDVAPINSGDTKRIGVFIARRLQTTPSIGVFSLPKAGSTNIFETIDHPAAAAHVSGFFNAFTDVNPDRLKSLVAQTMESMLPSAFGDEDRNNWDLIASEAPSVFRVGVNDDELLYIALALADESHYTLDLGTLSTVMINNAESRPIMAYSRMFDRRIVTIDPIEAIYTAALETHPSGSYPVFSESIKVTDGSFYHGKVEELAEVSWKLENKELVVSPEVFKKKRRLAANPYRVLHLDWDSEIKRVTSCDVTIARIQSWLAGVQVLHAISEIRTSEHPKGNQIIRKMLERHMTEVLRPVYLAGPFRQLTETAIRNYLVSIPANQRMAVFSNGVTKTQQFKEIAHIEFGLEMFSFLSIFTDEQKAFVGKILTSDDVLHTILLSEGKI
jgi:hypothetical protein